MKVIIYVFVLVLFMVSPVGFAGGDVADHVSLSQPNDMPVVTIEENEGGKKTITVTTNQADGTIRQVNVLVDSHGNKEVKMIITDLDGKKTTSVLANDPSVLVHETPSIVIGEDGTLEDE